MDRRLFLALGAAAALAGAPPAVAQTALSAEDAVLVERARAYLQGLTSVRGRFTQTDPRGQRSAGAFSLKRPGRVRFEYDEPSRLIVTADGTNVLVWDRRLRTFDRYPLGATPLDLFIGREIRLDRGVTVERVTRSGDSFTLSARGRRRQEGRIELTFASEPVRLRGWTVVDAQGRATRVSLSGLTPAALPNDLFVLRPPRSERNGGRP